MFEDRTPVWPGKPGAADAYPWRFRAAPELVLDEPDWLPAEARARTSSSTSASGPPEHWTLAFQGQLRTVSDHDARLLLDAMAARAATGAPVP